MEVFNKLYSQVTSSVSNTVSQLSGVLPGNPVTREFEASAHIASAGPGLLWKVYKGMKRSTKQEASIFVFEKRQLDKYNKTDRDIILETLRRGVTQLTKIRHPQILTVQHPLEESRESLAFATEPIFASLANILGQTINMPQPTPLSGHKFHDIEVKYGLLQIGEGLVFLHNDVRLLHKNIAPENIIVNEQGAWKLFGLDFCVHNTNPPNLAPFYPYDGYSPTLPDVCQPNLDYMAPECILTQSHSSASDMFSVGMLIFALNSSGRTISSVKDIQQFRARAQQLKNVNVTKLMPVPEALREHVKLLLNVTPELRLDAHQFIKVTYFDDVAVKTLNYLDSLLQWDNLQKSQFYKGLSEAVSKLPHRVKIQRVLPCLNRDLNQTVMVPFLLPTILDIAQDCTQTEYCTHIFPLLKPLMKLMEPIQIMLIFLYRMELLLKLTPSDECQQNVLPMLYRGLDSDLTQIHELCLNVLPTFAGLLNHSNVKNNLVPRIKKLCISTNNLSVRVNCLLCIGRLLDNFDKWLVLDEILPFLPQIPSREPAVLMGILGIYKLALNHKKLGITKEIVATRCLPFLMPLCIENGLTIQQFNALVNLIKEMFQLVETEQRTKLEQLNSVKEEQKILRNTVPVTANLTGKQYQLDQAFNGLGLDGFVSSSNSGSSMGVSSPTTTNSAGLMGVSSPTTTNSAGLMGVSSPTTTNSAGLMGVSSPTPTNSTGLMGVSSPTPTNSTGLMGVSSPTPTNSTSLMGASSPTLTNSTNYSRPSSNLMNIPPSSLNSVALPAFSSNSNTNWLSVEEKQNLAQQQTNMKLFSNQIQLEPIKSNQINNSLSFSVQNNTNFGGFSQNLNKVNNNLGNWSALDNLLPTNNTNKIPMSQMVGNKQPLLPQNGNTSNLLSKDDIMDFLS